MISNEKKNHDKAMEAMKQLEDSIRNGKDMLEYKEDVLDAGQVLLLALTEKLDEANKILKELSKYGR